MPRKLLVATLVAVSVTALPLAAFGQVAPPSSPGGSAAGSPGVSPATPPPSSATSPSPSTGGTTGLSNQPGVPNTSTPGTIGTGAAPSGLPGDSPSKPGYPDKVGR